MVEGGRGVCWADQREETSKEDTHLPFNDGVVLSPLAESNLHLDVPPSSVLLHTECLPSGSADGNKPSTNLDETVVLQPACLDVTFELSNPPTESTQLNVRIFSLFEILCFGELKSYVFFCLQSTTLIGDAPSLVLPLADLPTNVPLQSTSLLNGTISSPNNKENFSINKGTGSSSIPVKTPSKDPKVSNSLTPKFRRGNLFSKSSSDLATVSQRTQQSAKPSYMAATAASKFRGTNEGVFVEPSAPPATSARFGSNNPFK